MWAPFYIACIGDDALVENECAPIIDHAENGEFDQA
jgi:hypothetical protein